MKRKGEAWARWCVCPLCLVTKTVAGRCGHCGGETIGVGPVIEHRLLRRVAKAAKALVQNHGMCASWPRHRCDLCRALAALKEKK